MNNVLIHHSIKIFKGVLKIQAVSMTLQFQASIYLKNFKSLKTKVLELPIDHLTVPSKTKNLTLVKNKKNLPSMKTLNF